MSKKEPYDYLIGEHNGIKLVYRDPSNMIMSDAMKKKFEALKELYKDEEIENNTTFEKDSR